VPYYLRVAIDMDVRVGHWYTVKAVHGKVSFARRYDKLERAETVVLGACACPVVAVPLCLLTWGCTPGDQPLTLSVPSSRSSFPTPRPTAS
jgi:hypothetical protein